MSETTNNPDAPPGAQPTEGTPAAPEAATAAAEGSAGEPSVVPGRRLVAGAPPPDDQKPAEEEDTVELNVEQVRRKVLVTPLPGLRHAVQAVILDRRREGLALELSMSIDDWRKEWGL